MDDVLVVCDDVVVGYIVFMLCGVFGEVVE